MPLPVVPSSGVYIKPQRSPAQHLRCFNNKHLEMDLTQEGQPQILNGATRDDDFSESGGESSDDVAAAKGKEEEYQNENKEEEKGEGTENDGGKEKTGMKTETKKPKKKTKVTGSSRKGGRKKSRISDLVQSAKRRKGNGSKLPIKKTITKEKNQKTAVTMTLAGKIKNKKKSKSRKDATRRREDAKRSREVVREQKKTENIIKKGAFKRLSKCILADIDPKLRIKKEALRVLQEAAEMDMIKEFQRADIVLRSSDRQTLYPRDMAASRAVKAIL